MLFLFTSYIPLRYLFVFFKMDKYINIIKDVSATSMEEENEEFGDES